MTDVVVVESPAKAKTINKYLGEGFTVLASFGHVRDLPPKDGSVRPDQDFAMDWASDERGSKQVGAIARALKGAKTLYLATDPDREGEAISWHVRAMLEDSHALRGKTVHRITFNEVTKSAVRYAIEHPRPLDLPLIEAYMARRALDYLVGFTLSPILWRKLPGSRSAGRVQSVSLRLICEREAEIEVFRAREYWSVEAQFVTPGGRAVRRPVDASGRQKARPVRSERSRQGRGREGSCGSRRLFGGLGRAAAREEKSAAAVHHQHAATGIVAQAGDRGAGHHAAGAAIV